MSNVTGPTTTTLPSPTRPSCTLQGPRCSPVTQGGSRGSITHREATGQHDSQGGFSGCYFFFINVCCSPGRVAARQPGSRG